MPVNITPQQLLIFTNTN